MFSVKIRTGRIDGHQRAADTIIDLSPINEDTTAEEYAVKLAAAGLM